MDIYLTNNLTNKKEQFIPRDIKNVGMYVCGPTVYDDPHIGNARPLVIFDILFKILKNNFPKVTYVRNITDIDDKIILSSRKLKITTKELTEKITKSFFDIAEHSKCHPGLPGPQGDSQEGSSLIDGFHNTKSSEFLLLSLISTLEPAIKSSNFLFDNFP